MEIKENTVRKEFYFTLYVGTYTKEESKGIYEHILEANCTLKKIGLVAKTNIPSFWAKSSDGKLWGWESWPTETEEKWSVVRSFGYSTTLWKRFYF